MQISLSRYGRALAMALTLALTGLIPALHAEDTPPTQSNAFLFSIEKRGFAKSYVFGTIHLPDSRVTKLPDNVREAFRASKAVYTEIPMEPEAMLEAAKAMMLEPGTSLKDLVPKATLDRFEEELHAINPELNVGPFLAMKPWAASMLLMMLETQLKNPGQNAMDLSMYQIAKSDGKRVGGLERPEEQIKLFESFTAEEQIQLMDSMLDQMQAMRLEGKNYTDELVNAYLSGDLQVLEQLMVDYEMSDKGLQDKFETLFITDRNKWMAKGIEMRMSAHPNEQTFFAVGAAHLYGDEGIPANLRKMGFTVKQVD